MIPEPYRAVSGEPEVLPWHVPVRQRIRQVPPHAQVPAGPPRAWVPLLRQAGSFAAALPVLPKMPLPERTFRCPGCDAGTGRDDNAAPSIRKKVLRMPAESPETGCLMGGREPAEPNACGHYGRHGTCSGQLHSGSGSRKPPASQGAARKRQLLPSVSPARHGSRSRPERCRSGKGSSGRHGNPCFPAGPGHAFPGGSFPGF